MRPEEAKLVADFLLSNIEAEIPATVGVFGAVPPNQLEYRPDALSKSALGLLRHIALEDEWFLNSVADGQFTPPPDDSDACGIATPQDAVARYQQRMPAAIAKVRGLSGEQLVKDVDLLGMIRMPAVQFLSLMMRHSAHHRGQLSAYLRPMGAKVPSIYGPTADTLQATA